MIHTIVAHAAVAHPGHLAVVHALVSALALTLVVTALVHLLVAFVLLAALHAGVLVVSLVLAVRRACSAIVSAVIHALVVRAVAVSSGGLARYEVHAADGAGVRLAPDDLRVHGTDVLGLGADGIQVEVGGLGREGAPGEDPPQLATPAATSS